MIFVFTLILTYFAYTVVFKKISNEIIRFTASYFTSAIVVSTMTLSICSDGWSSGSIGTQGACSHHGGVTDQLNAFGLVIFILCCVVFVVVMHMKTKEMNKSNDVIHKKDIQIQAVTEVDGIIYYRTLSRSEEQMIRDYCDSNDIEYKFRHEIVSSEIVACFKFFTADDLERAKSSI